MGTRVEISAGKQPQPQTITASTHKYLSQALQLHLWLGTPVEVNAGRQPQVVTADKHKHVSQAANGVNETTDLSASADPQPQSSSIFDSDAASVRKKDEETDASVPSYADVLGSFVADSVPKKKENEEYQTGETKLKAASQFIPAKPSRIGSLKSAVDCIATAWSSWGACSKRCDTGMHKRIRKLLAADGGLFVE